MGDVPAEGLSAGPRAVSGSEGGETDEWVEEDVQGDLRFDGCRPPVL